MPMVEMRRSSRVMISVPVKISGVDNRGREFLAQARTLVVNNHGAMILSSRRLAPGMEIELSAFRDTAHSRARVVRIAGRNKGLSSWEVAAELDVPGNFWRINFPPEDWVRPVSESAQAEERAAGLRPRPLIQAEAAGKTRSVEEQAPTTDAAFLQADPASPEVSSVAQAADLASNALRAVEAAAMAHASETLLTGMTPEDKLRRFQVVTGALLRALMRRGLLTERELREALESVEGELTTNTSRPRT